MTVNWLNDLGDRNPQLLRELRGRFQPRSIGVTIAIVLVGQLLLLAFFAALLPGDDNAYISYCLAGSRSPCQTDWPRWWAAIFTVLTGILPYVLYVMFAGFSGGAQTRTLGISGVVSGIGVVGLIAFAGVPAITLVNLLFLGRSGLQEESAANMVVIRWFDLLVNQNWLLSHLFVFGNIALLTYWLWRVLQRTFRKPTATALSKRQAYVVVTYMLFLGLGFMVPWRGSAADGLMLLPTTGKAFGSAVLGLALSVTLVANYAVLVQLMLLIETAKPYVWVTGSVIFAIVIPGFCMAIPGLNLLAGYFTPGLWFLLYAPFSGSGLNVALPLAFVAWGVMMVLLLVQGLILRDRLRRLARSL